MGRRENREATAKSKLLIKILIVVVAIIIITFIGLKIYNNIRNARPNNANLVINNNNVTSKLKKDVIIENDTVYLSQEDIKNFFDKYIYKDEETNQIITTYEKKIAALKLDSKKVTINGAEKQINSQLKQENDTIYLPMTELDDVYNVEITYNNNTNFVTMDSLDREQVKAYASKNLSVKEKPSAFSWMTDKVNKGNWLIFASDANDGWAKVRTQNGIVGYVKKDKLANFDTVRENMKEEKQIEGNVNIAWDYFQNTNKHQTEMAQKLMVLM